MITPILEPLPTERRNVIIEWLNRPECAEFLHQIDILESEQLAKFADGILEAELQDLEDAKREVCELRKARMLIEDMLSGKFLFQKVKTL